MPQWYTHLLTLWNSTCLRRATVIYGCRESWFTQSCRNEKSKRKLDRTVLCNWRKYWGRTTARGHTNCRKTWPPWNKETLLLSKIVQENASQKNERYWTDVQNTALSCTITRPMEIHQYWTVPRQTQRMTTPSFLKEWSLQYNYWRKGSHLESTTSRQNWPKQVERMLPPFSQ